MRTNSDKHWISADWPAPANVFAGTTLRGGGLSGGGYGSLNPALHVGDHAPKVYQNRQIIKQMLELPAEPVWLHQVHGSRVINIAETCRLEAADAGYSNRPGVVCAVLTADCLPILICSEDGQWVAALHAGWRGLLAGVIENCVRLLATNDLLAWLGPAIGPQAFEVGPEVRQAFCERNAVYDAAFYPGRNGKWQADIYRLARLAFAQLGVDRIYGGGFCTVSEPESFYSYRRDRVTGRMASLIWRT